jgi:hypothetical protein
VKRARRGSDYWRKSSAVSPAPCSQSRISCS